MVEMLSSLVAAQSSIAADVKRIADALAPAPPDVVGTPYVAQKLGATTTWIADLVRQGEIPSRCLVPGTGNGKPWKFYRGRIDEWLTSR
jgi:predicted DNA-binding transcriptional regulator AlpA